MILIKKRTSASQPATDGTVSFSLRRRNADSECKKVTVSVNNLCKSVSRVPLEIAAVALPLPVEQTYSYAVPRAMQKIVRVGSAVLVPFGRRSLTGIVTAEGKALKSIVTMEGKALDAGKTRNEKRVLKEILDILDTEPAITGDQMKLAQWIADYYLCGLGEVLRAALPPGIGSSSEQRISRIKLEDPTAAEDGSMPAAAEDSPIPLSKKDKEILDALPESGSVSVKSLLLQNPSVTRSQLQRLESRGLLAIEFMLRGPRTTIRKMVIVHLSGPAAREEPGGIKQRAVLNALRHRARSNTANEGVTLDSGLPRDELLKQTGASTATVKRLQELGFVTLSEREIDRSRARTTNTEAIKPPPNHDLDPTQVNAIERIGSAIVAGRFETFLLHGVTGSGKTEVYIEALKLTRKQGKSGIILVPEISLTPQTVARFRSHFGEEIAVLHSRMSPGERFDAWRGIRAGKYPVVIGPRSAVLAPVDNLGLIVVDEEHEQSYKQFDPAPRYHARDVAVVRARQASAACVLGSATPSLESLTNAQTKKYILLSMPERVKTHGRRAKLPEVRVVDMRNRSATENGSSVLSTILSDAIEKRLLSGEQIILLQNRRGYAPTVRCEQCNWAPDCPDCSVTMIYHKSRRHLRCHYCGRTRKLPPRCPSCGNESVLQLGIGTQRVEEEILNRFPTARVARMDLDTTTFKNAHHKILDRFARGEADILLGTQMVSKGLDFGNVSLVGIIDADTGIYLPDIRAEERTFQLLTQVAGRAGRAELPGEVILQTHNPGHRVIQYAMQHDYDRFARNVLPERQALDYPPFGRIIAVLFSGPDANRVNRIALDWCREARKIDSSITILGPSPSFIGRIRKNHRSQILIKIERLRSHRGTRALIRQTNKALGNPPRNYRIAVDVDPIGLA